jgi:hypothetical protein
LFVCLFVCLFVHLAVFFRTNVPGRCCLSCMSNVDCGDDDDLTPRDRFQIEAGG